MLHDFLHMIDLQFVVIQTNTTYAMLCIPILEELWYLIEMYAIGCQNSIVTVSYKERRTVQSREPGHYSLSYKTSRPSSFSILVAPQVDSNNQPAASKSRCMWESEFKPLTLPFGSVQELRQRRIFFMFLWVKESIHLCVVEPIARALPGAVLLKSPLPDVFQAFALSFVDWVD